MSVAVSNHQPPPGRGGPAQRRPRRVRHEAREALAVFAFSAGASIALAIAITLVVTLVG
jgi:hypothetical protein